MERHHQCDEAKSAYPRIHLNRHPRLKRLHSEDSIARPPNLWPGIQVSAGTIDLQAAKQMPFMRQKIVNEIRLLSAASTKDSPDILNPDRIFSAAGRRSNALVKIALFCGLPGVVGGISAFSLEIRRSPGTFLLVREVSNLQLNFSIFS